MRSLSISDRGFGPSSSSSTVGPRPRQPPSPPTPCSWLVPGLLHTSRFCTSPPVQRHTEGASRLTQGENQLTNSHHRVPLPVVSGVGRKVRKKRMCCFHIIKQVRGIAGTKQGQSTCWLGHRLCLFFFLFFFLGLLP